MPQLLRALTGNWQLKLLAIALAVLLWVVISAEQVTSNWIPVPLIVRVTDESFQLAGDVPREVQVRFTGPGREFFDLAVRRPPLVLTVSEVRDAEQIFDLNPSDVRLPNALDEVSATAVDPGFIRLRFRQTASRTLPVRVDVASGPGRGYTLVGPLRLRPAEVEATGPADQVRRLAAVATVPTTLPSGDSTFTKVVALDTVGLDGVRLSARVVRVSGRVERVVERELEDVAVSVGPGLRIEPARVTVRFRGARSAVEGLARDDFRVVLALDSIPTRVDPDGQPAPLRLEGVPAGLDASVTPAATRIFPARLRLDTVPVRRVAPDAGEPDAAP